MEGKRIPGGLVIIFEGIDGVGKTTQLQMAATTLQTDGWLIHATRSHGGTPIGEQLREVSLGGLHRPPATDLYISRAIHEALREELADHRRNGEIILIDRGPLSLAAYQIYGDSVDPEIGWREVETDIACFSAELIITYTASVNIALERAKHRSKGKADYFESKPAHYFEKVHQGFLETSERFQATIIDAEDTLENVHNATMVAIRAAIDQSSSK
jgi:dTMP kinase